MPALMKTKKSKPQEKSVLQMHTVECCDLAINQVSEEDEECLNCYMATWLK